MKFQGRIKNWNDGKGFGFVEPNGGGERAFVHIKAFESRSCRPVDGDIITYALMKDGKSRYRAGTIRFARDNAKSQGRNKGKGGWSWPTLLTLVFIAFLAVMTM